METKMSGEQNARALCAVAALLCGITSAMAAEWLLEQRADHEGRRHVDERARLDPAGLHVRRARR
jgi:hypothetical protein